MRGSATPMIEVSMITMNWAAAISDSAHQRRDDAGELVDWLTVPLLYLYRVYDAAEPRSPLFNSSAQQRCSHPNPAGNSIP
jgi:hypothetical protein